MTRTAEVIVLGLGAVGSAALYALAKMGVDVLGVERFHPGHDRGSSHGDSRITRVACGEGEIYSRSARRSSEIRKEIEDRTGETLFQRTGLLVIGPEDPSSARNFHGRSGFLATTIAAARMHGVPHEELSEREIKDRYPLFRADDDERGYYEPDAGILFPERTVRATVRAAIWSGARIATDERIMCAWNVPEGIELLSEREHYACKRLVIAAGAWGPSLLPVEYERKFRVRRQLLHWFSPKTDRRSFSPEKCPVYIWEGVGIYGFPELDPWSVKVALGDDGPEADPDDLDRTVHANEAIAMKERLETRIPALAGTHQRALACMYTKTPDGDFVIDWHPELRDTLFLSACSGHGFKHALAVGELAARSVAGESRSAPIERFSWSRLFM